MLRVVGAPAIGTAFYDREVITKKIEKRLKNGSLLLAAPRRFGKTSIMLKVKEDLEKENILIMYLDIEWVNTPTDFVVETLCKLKDAMGPSFKKYVKELPKGLVDSIKENIENVELPFFKLSLKQELQENWMDKGRELFIALRKTNTQVILLMDEFPLMLQNFCDNKDLQKQDILNFLQWLRSLRIETTAKMLLGGSIGVDHILEKLKASATINDVERIQLEPFDNDTAKKFIKALFTTERMLIDDKIASEMLELIGEPVPYFIQVFVSAILNEIESSNRPLTGELVQLAYARRVLGIECKTYFEHYFQRLSVYYEPFEVEIVKALLQELATRQLMSKKEMYIKYCTLTEKPSDEQFIGLLTTLESEFYIVFSSVTSNYSFSTRVLRDLWLYRYGMVGKLV